MKKYFPAFLFIFLLAGVAAFYRYHQIVVKRPQSVHMWRQSDCASLALNYYQNGMNFFQPEVHNLTSDSERSGKSATSEIPVLYYTAAGLYHIFGYNDSILRGLNTLFFLVGLFFLFLLLDYLLGNSFWAGAITLLVFSSPVLVYYGNNFLSNSSALSFSFIGWYFFTRYYFESRRKLLWLAMVFFFFAAAFKVSALFSFFAVAGIFVFEKINWKQFGKEGNLFVHPRAFLVAAGLLLLLVGGWIKYASWYNFRHHSTYFSTTIFPVWDLNRDQIKSVLENVWTRWWGEYFHFSAKVFLFLGLIFILLNLRKNRPVWSYAILLVFVQAVAYILLQFWTFADHDYYTIDLFIIPVLVLISLFDLLRNHYSRVFNSVISKGIFAGLVVFNIWYANERLMIRYQPPLNNFEKRMDWYTATPYLRSIGIRSDDKIISIPDGSHASLYLLNQKGWTEYINANYNRGGREYYSNDSAGIERLIQLGAKYLFVNGLEEFYKKPYLQPFAHHLFGRQGTLFIFKLRSEVNNFSFKNENPSQVFSCGAEILSEDKLSFRDDSLEVFYQNGQTQNRDMAHTGEFSSKLYKETPYGMTKSLTNLELGQRISFSAWRKYEGKPCGLLIAATSPSNEFYSGEFRVVENSPEGWEKISMEIVVNEKMVGKELVLYLYNPKEEAVFFDDLEIKVYAPIKMAVSGK